MDLFLAFLAPVLATIGGAAIIWHLIAESLSVCRLSAGRC
jgi:hypothetical protein